MSASFGQLPQEVLCQIFFQVPPLEIPRIQQVCKKFNDLCGPLLWRHCCRMKYQYWNPNRHIEDKSSDEVAKNNWKQIYAERHRIDRDIDRAIDSILDSQVGRIKKTQGVVELGYDAKDSLLRHLNVADDAKDVLARRWYSSVALSCLHRSVAIEQWLKLRKGEHIPLEKALGAFDMFVVQDGKGDIYDVSSILDRIASRFRQEHNEFNEMNIRTKAIAVASYIRAHDLVGINDDVDAHYHDLRNNFIGIALTGDYHPSLPLISVAIYCCVAQRLGIDASPCGFPFHVLAIVRASDGITLDGQESRCDSESQLMYMDPFRSSLEIPKETLATQLVSIGAPQRIHEKLLDIAQTSDLVVRCAKNVVTSIQTLPRETDADPIASPIQNIDSASYAALWAFILLPDGDDERQSVVRQAHYLPVVIKHMKAQFPTDVWVMEKNYVALFGMLEGHQEIADSLRAIRADDETPKKVKSRGSQTSRSVRYRVGQTFLHKRYRYRAIITGWDVECAASDLWMSQMRVYDLPRGKHQSFYHALVEDKSTRYVAEENIEIVEQTPSEDLMALAGQYFKRWDSERKTFVSNIRDEYPDD